jgi:hypothetical protein
MLPTSLVIIYQSNGGELEAIESRISQEIETILSEEHLLLVVIADIVVAGFGRASYFLPLPEHPLPVVSVYYFRVDLPAVAC